MNPSPHCHQHTDTGSCNHLRATAPFVALPVPPAQLHSPPLRRAHHCTVTSTATLTTTLPHPLLHCHQYSHTHRCSPHLPLHRHQHSCTYRRSPAPIIALPSAQLHPLPLPHSRCCTVVNTLAATSTAALFQCSCTYRYTPAHLPAYTHIATTHSPYEPRPRVQCQGRCRRSQF